MGCDTRYTIEFDPPFVGHKKFRSMLAAEQAANRAGVSVPPEVVEFFREPVHQLAKLIVTQPGSDASLAVGMDLNSGDKCSWYRHEDELGQCSAAVPDVLITLSGDGEDSDDVWRKYFKGGKVQTAQAVTTYEPFDEAKLREPQYID